MHIIVAPLLPTKLKNLLPNENEENNAVCMVVTAPCTIGLGTQGDKTRGGRGVKSLSNNPGHLDYQTKYFSKDKVSDKFDKIILPKINFI